MNKYLLLKAANRTTRNDKIFNHMDFYNIEDFTTWETINPDEPVEILAMDIFPATEFEIETLKTENLIVNNREFDDIVRDIVMDALENGKPLRAS